MQEKVHSRTIKIYCIKSTYTILQYTQRTN